MGIRPVLIGIIVWILSVCQVPAQSPVFRFPLDTVPLLSGTFGEFRGSHFHAGIDIKTYGKVGLPVHAAASGYVSRIKISPYGYGKAVYLTHENGYTTVYGHLSRFEPTLEAYIRKNQYLKKSYTIELFPERSRFRVNQGDVIAWTGNSGGSYAPHLHFEVRDSYTQDILNPLSMAFELTDTLAPQLTAVQIWERERIHKQHQGFYPKVAEKSAIGQDTLRFELCPGTYGLALAAKDFRTADTSNILGVYSLSVQENGQELYKREQKRFSFSDGRYIHLVSRYEEGLPPIEFCFAEPWQSHGVASYYNGGWIELRSGDPVRYLTILLRDEVGQETRKILAIVCYDCAFRLPPFNYTQPAEQEKLVFQDATTWYIKGSKHYVDFFQNSLFDSLFIGVSIKKGLSDTLLISPPDAVIAEKFRIAYALPANLPAKREKLCLAQSGSAGPEYIGGEVSNTHVLAYTRNTGTYFLSMDTLAPKVDSLWNSTDSLMVTVSDDFSGIARYRAFIDQRWFLMEYDPKTNQLYGDLSGFPSGTRLDFKLILTDNRENTYIFQSKLLIP